MTNSMWVTLLYFLARQTHPSHFPWSTGSEWHCDYFISLPDSLINHVSSHDQQLVSGTALFPCQAVSSIMSHPMTNRKWVTLLYFLARESHQSCLITWPTVCEWHFFISLQGSLINHVSSHDQQDVSDTATFRCQVVSSIMSHREWVTLLYFYASQSHQLCLIPWPTASELHCFISLPGSLISCVTCVSHLMTNRRWVTALFARQSHQSCLIPWPTASECHYFISLPGSCINHVSSHDHWTGSEWHYFIFLPGSLINHVTSYDQQQVSDTALFPCQAVSSIMPHPMTNRKWVTLLNFFCQVVSSIMSHPMTNSMWVTLFYSFARQPH